MFKNINLHCLRVLLHYLYLVSGAALKTCSHENVFWKCAANLQENTLVEL